MIHTLFVKYMFLNTHVDLDVYNRRTNQEIVTPTYIYARHICLVCIELDVSVFDV